MKGVARPRLRLLLMSTHKLSPFDHHHDSRIIIELFVCLLFVCLIWSNGEAQDLSNTPTIP